jgi:hypothetical protein
MSIVTSAEQHFTVSFSGYRKGRYFAQNETEPETAKIFYIGNER